MADDLRERIVNVLLSHLPRSEFTPAERRAYAAQLADHVIAIRDSSPDYWRERIEQAEATLSRVRDLADVYETNARTVDGVAARNFFELFAEDLRAALDPAPELLAEEETGPRRNRR